MPRPIRGAGLACVTVVAVALLGGCSGTGEAPGGSPVAQDAGALTAGDPAALLAGAAAATFASGSTRFALQMQVSSGGQDTTASGAGSYDFARKVGDISVTTTGSQRGQVDVIMDGATFYTRLPGQEGWTRTQAHGATASGQQYDPAQQLDILQKVSSGVRVVGIEELRGEQVRHLAFTIDPASLAAASGLTGDGAVALHGGGPISGDVYIDDAGRVRKLQTRMTMDIAGSNTAMNVVSEYIEFGVPVTVQAPDPATVR